MDNHCSRRQRTQQSSGNRNTDRGGRGRGATREGRRRGEAEGGAWAETTPPGHVIQGNAPAHGGSPTQSTEREGQLSSCKDNRACERFWRGSSPHRERDTADRRHHGAPVRPCKQAACPLEQAPAGR